MGTTCQSACVICDINGFSGNNPGNTGGTPPPGYCTAVVHSAEWLGFIAGSTNLTIEFSVYNCTVGGGNGLEAGIYEGIDCQNFTLVSNCETAIFNNTSVFITNTVPLTIGQYYWIVVDSNGGNSCDYDINVTSGTTQVPPLSTSGQIFGDLTTCPGATVNYQTTSVIGASDYNWTLNGAPTGSGENASISYPAAGVYNLCVEASNACSMAAPTCVLVNVVPIPPTDHFETICLGDCVTVGNVTLCAPGVFPIMFSSYQGCDSLVNVNITAIPASVTVLDEEICEGESIIINTEEFDTTGVFNVGLTGYQGCDSTIVLNLTVNSSPETFLIEEICEGSFFEVGNDSFSVTGNYQIPFTSSNCDSTVFLDLTVLAIQESFLTEEICNGDSYVLANDTFSTSGNYQVPFLDENGCDSLVNLDLTVLTSPQTFLKEAICDGESYQVGNESFDTTGNYQITLNDQNGCDSLVDLDLTVLLTPFTALEEQICTGEVFTVGTEEFDQTGIFQVSLTAGNGCDSLVELDLVVTSILETNLKESICAGDTFLVGNESFDSTGTYQIMLSSISGCDSLVLLKLEVLKALETNLTESICAGESFNLGNETFENSGIYEVPFMAVSGCDSTVYLDLTVFEQPETNLPQTICEGDSVQVGNQIFKQNGQYEIVLFASTGCDSTVYLDLEVVQNLETFLTEEICSSGSYFVGNEEFTTSGVYQVPFIASSGCDSLVHLDLTVYPSADTTLNPSICEGDVYIVGPYPFYDSGQYTTYLTTVNGCDSVIHLNLEVTTFLETQLMEQICEGDLFQVGNDFFDQSGNYEVILPTPSGCDSIVNLDLTVHNLPQTFLIESICEGEGFQIGTELFNQNGNFEVILPNQYNCDSTIFLDLTLIPPKQTILIESICQGQSFQVGNEAFDQNGQYDIVLTAATGCDSLVNLDLTIIPPQLHFLSEMICEGESYSIGNETFTQSGQYDVPLQATSGCDSIITLDLMVTSIPETFLNEAICDGEIYEVGNEQFDDEGQYAITLIATSGCDSIVNLDLTIHLEPEIFLAESICEGETWQVGIDFFDQTGQYQVPLLTALGCDSLVNLDLEVIPNEQTFLNEMICQNESYFVGNEEFTQTGQYQVLLNTFQGCDSLVDLNLEVIPFEMTNLVEEICEGETFQVGSEGFDETGQYQVILTAASGCDSIVDLDLLVEVCAIFGAIEDDLLLCAGDTDGVLNFSIQGGTAPYQFIWEQVSGALSGTGTINDLNGSYQLENLPVGFYSITITDNDGLTETLLGQVEQPDWLGLSLDISEYGDYNVSCNGGQDGFVNGFYHGGTAPYELQWSSGVQDPLALSAGQYSLTITDANGCTISESFTLTQPSALSFEFETVEPLCKPKNSGSISVQNTSGGVPDYLYAISGNDFGQISEFINLPPGDYEIALQDANGCKIQENVHLPKPPDFKVELGDDITINLGESILLTPTLSLPANTFMWENTLGLSCYDCPNPFAQPVDNSRYVINAFTEEGCEATDGINILVLKNRRVYIPNAFSPNADGINDVFMVFGGPEVAKVNSLQIFSRWGEPVFEYFDFQPDDPRFGWDGTYKGEKMQSAVFAWFVEVEFLDGELLTLKGDVTLVK